MPSTGYGARNNGKRIGGDEEIGSEVSGQSCILHADLDADGSFLSCSEMENLADEIADGIA